MKKSPLDGAVQRNKSYTVRGKTLNIRNLQNIYLATKKKLKALRTLVPNGTYNSNRYWHTCLACMLSTRPSVVRGWAIQYMMAYMPSG